MSDEKQSRGLFLKYFVLNPTKNTPYGEASRKALVAYAEAIDRENPKLAFELQSWARQAAAKLGKKEVNDARAGTSKGDRI